MDPRELVRSIEATASLPAGVGDRFAGYSVMGLTFASGHVLALRRFPASSVGPGYTSVWHRTPAGLWTFYSTVPAVQGCERYFGGEIESNVCAPIRVDWQGPSHLRVLVETRQPIDWYMTLCETPVSRMMNAAARKIPDRWWRNRFVLRMISLASSVALDIGWINLSGLTPNGQRFLANPQRLWLVGASRAFINGVFAGEMAPLAEQPRLGDFHIPQRGIFAVGRSFLTGGNHRVLDRTSSRFVTGTAGISGHLTKASARDEAPQRGA